MTSIKDFLDDHLQSRPWPSWPEPPRVMQVQTPPTRSVTKSVTIDRPAAEVHAFLADAANWPRWAIINVLAIEPGDESGWWKLSTPDGPAEFRIRADSVTGLVDHDFRDETKEVATVPARVVGNGRGRFPDDHHSAGRVERHHIRGVARVRRYRASYPQEAPGICPCLFVTCTRRSKAGRPQAVGSA